jgi:hypothetical protein
MTLSQKYHCNLCEDKFNEDHTSMIVSNLLSEFVLVQIINIY